LKEPTNRRNPVPLISCSSHPREADSREREGRVLSKEPYILSKEPRILSKEPYILSKESYILSKQPYHIVNRALYIIKKALSLKPTLYISFSLSLSLGPLPLISCSSHPRGVGGSIEPYHSSPLSTSLSLSLSLLLPCHSYPAHHIREG